MINNNETSEKDVVEKVLQNSIQVNFNTLYNQNFNLIINPSLCVIELKKLVAQNLGDKIEDLKLSLHGTFLNDEEIISTYNIKNKDTLLIIGTKKIVK